MTLVINTRRLPEQAMTIAIEPQGALRPEDADLLRGRFVMVLAATHPERIVVDFSAVPTISDAGIAALRSGCNKSAACGTSVVLVHADPHLRERLRSHGLAELVDVPAAR